MNYAEIETHGHTGNFREWMSLNSANKLDEFIWFSSESLLGAAGCCGNRARHIHRFASMWEQDGNALDRATCNSDVREPTLSSEASQEMLRATNIHEEELKAKRRTNSVDSLSPKSRFLASVNTIPMTPGVPDHTIISDRGIVPSDHSAHQNPQAIEDAVSTGTTKMFIFTGHSHHRRKRALDFWNT